MGKDQGIIPIEEAEKVLNSEGKLLIQTFLRYRVKYITHALAIGSKSYVENLECGFWLKPMDCGLQQE